jgi:hypothetical protein
MIGRLHPAALAALAALAAILLAACSYPRPPPLGDDDGAGDGPPCQATCADFTTLRCEGAADQKCGGDTPICRRGACVASPDPSFGARYSLPATDSAAAFGLVDVDGDARLDVVAALVPANATSYALGKPDRTFGAAIEVALTRAMYFGDLNRDGRADLLVRSGTSTLSSFLGNGGGVWTTAQSGITSSASASTTGLLADLDEDGSLDFLHADGLGVYVYYGRGDGTFESLVVLTTVSAAAQVIVGDTSGDRHPDLLVRENAGSIEVFARTGPRTYAPGVVNSSVAASELTLAADFDGDGRADLLTTTADKAKVAFLSSRGDGTFGNPVLTPSTMSIRAIAAGDFNADGVPDLALIQPFDSIDQTVLAFIGRGDGTFKIVTTNVRDTQVRSALQTADLTGAGRTDIFYMVGSNGGIYGVPAM